MIVELVLVLLVFIISCGAIIKAFQLRGRLEEKEKDKKVK